MDDSLSKLLQPDLTTLARQVQLPQNTAVLLTAHETAGGFGRVPSSFHPLPSWMKNTIGSRQRHTCAFLAMLLVAAALFLHACVDGYEMSLVYDETKRGFKAQRRLNKAKKNAKIAFVCVLLLIAAMFGAKTIRP